MLLRWAFAEIQREDGESVYFRLSTRPIEQPTRHARCGPRRRDHRRRLLAARARAGRGSGDRLLRRGRPRGARRPWRADRGRAAGRAARDHLARPAAPRLARRPGRAAARARPSGCWRGCGRVRPRHRRRLPSGDIVLARRRPRTIRSSRSGSSGLANRATFPTSTAPTASTTTRSSTPPRAPACWRCAEVGTAAIFRIEYEDGSKSFSPLTLGVGRPFDFDFVVVDQATCIAERVALIVPFPPYTARCQPRRHRARRRRCGRPAVSSSPSPRQAIRSGW